MGSLECIRTGEQDFCRITQRHATRLGWHVRATRCVFGENLIAGENTNNINDGARNTADREIVITRVFDAPRELVWEARISPKHIALWWGPNGFTTTIHEMDVRPGDVWRFIMHGSDGNDYPNKIVYSEVVKPERLVYAHGGDGDSDDVAFNVTVSFIDEGGKTRLTMRSLFKSAAERDKVVKEYGAIEGGNQTLARLAEFLARM
jgi:uncharacterized protein YndB with AHSA1/START domain